MDDHRDFARTWLAEWTPDPPSFGAATDELHDLIVDNPEEAWQRILVLVDVSTTQQLNLVGAGPLEDLLCEHGSGLIDRVETAARNNPQLVEALTSVWGWNRMDPVAYKRLRSLAPLRFRPKVRA